MKNYKKLIPALALSVIMTACGGTSNSQTSSSNGNNNDSPYAFEFVGSGKTGGAIDTSSYPYVPLEGVDFTVTIRGDKNSNEVELSVKEAPQIVMGGTYEFVNGKGYKIYLEDNHHTFVYTKYDTSTKTFSFNTTIVFNIAIGFLDATYTYKDESFASQYDGVGFTDVNAPVFESAVSVMPGGKCLLKTDDKGNFIWYGLSGMGGDYCKRSGTWSYDSVNDEYVFNFNDGVFRNLTTLWMTINWSEANIETYRGGDTSGLLEYPAEATTDIDTFNEYLANNNYFDGEVRAKYSKDKGYYYMNFAMMNCLGTDYTSGAPGWAWATYTPASK